MYDLHIKNLSIDVFGKPGNDSVTGLRISDVNSPIKIDNIRVKASGDLSSLYIAGLNFRAANLEVIGAVDIHSIGIGLLAVEGYGGGTSNFKVLGGGTIHGNGAGINIKGQASGHHIETTGVKISGRNAIAIACIESGPQGCTSDIDSYSFDYWTGPDSHVFGSSISLSGGSATGTNVLYVHQPESFITLNASNSAALSGNVVTASDTVGTNTPTDINLASGATLTGAVMGGGGATGSEAGDATQRANIALNLNNATWTLTGSSSLKTLNNGAGGKVDFGNFSGSYKSLTVKDYAGGGDITFNTFLGDSSSPSDKLIIDGGSATGSSRVWVRNTGGLGAQTTGNGILLVEAINGGTTAPSAFALGQPVIAGAYDYSLKRGGENWYLSSEATTTPAPPPPPPAPAPSPAPAPAPAPAPSPAPAPAPAPAPTPEPAPSPSPSPAPSAAAPTPAPAPIPSPAPAPLQNYRAESSLYAALPSQALMGMNQALELPTTLPPASVSVQTAAADTTTALTALTERERALQEPGTWVRVLGTQARNRAEGQSANGSYWAQFKANTELLQLGRHVAQSNDGAAQQAWQVFGALGAVSGDVTHTNAAGQRSTAGSNKVEIASLGAALSQRFDAKRYLEAAALVSHLRVSSASVRGLGFKTSGTGFGAALEMGQRLALNSGWGWQPHALLRVQQASLGNTSDEAGQVRLGDARSAQAGLGATFHTLGDGPTQFTTTARLLHEFAGRPGVVLADASGYNGPTVGSSTRGTALQIKAGVEHRIGQDSKLFATVNHTQGLTAGNRKSSDTGIALGAKVNW